MLRSEVVPLRVVQFDIDGESLVGCGEFALIAGVAGIADQFPCTRANGPLRILVISDFPVKNSVSVWSVDRMNDGHQ
ncbi:MAG: hypothetical protein M2R45_01904 [Verrucomicrobia subdivision 3 bacterium]|nr:hypothetical protein [Limisphaerales bacterium]MCS1415702.1 hypothetical protein [Limisphaerales bacterium]